MEKVVSIPNDMVAIIVEKTDNKNNTYNLIPIEVSTGKIDSFGRFISSDGKYVLSSAEDPNFYLSEESIYAYAFADSVDNIKDKYKDIEKFSFMLYEYLKEIGSKLNLVLKTQNEIRIFQKDYNCISDEICGDVLKRLKSKEELEPKEVALYVPEKNYDKYIDEEELEKYLKERILGNDDTIEDIATTVVLNQTAKTKQEVESILAIGPTGSGKTATFEAIAEYLNIPLTIYDCNQLTAAGYVGKDVDDVIRQIYYNCNGNMELAARSILVLDEVDKLAMRGHDVKDASVQYALLKLLDGYDYSVEKKKNGPVIEFDSSFLTIACLGAFPEMYEKKDSTKKMKLGFAQDTSLKEDKNIIYQFTPDDLKEFGMLREFIGRNNNIVTFRKLTKEYLKEVLLHSKNSPLLKKVNRYKDEFNVDTEIEDEFIDYLVEKAYEENIGGRGLTKIISKTFKKLDREMVRTRKNTLYTQSKKIVLRKDMVENNKAYNI